MSETANKADLSLFVLALVIVIVIVLLKAFFDDIDGL